MAQKLNLDTSAELNLTMVEGVDYSLECTILDDDGLPYVLTGMTITIEFRKDINSTSADISFVSPTNITIASNVFTWNISNSKTASKGGYDYYYAIVITDLASLKNLFIRGVATINEKAVI